MELIKMIFVQGMSVTSRYDVSVTGCCPLSRRQRRLFAGQSVWIEKVDASAALSSRLAFKMDS